MAKRISDAVLKRYLAGDETLDALAGDVGISRQALSKRLASPPIQKRLLALEDAAEKPAPARPAKRKGKPSIPETPPDTPADSTPRATGRIMGFNSRYAEPEELPLHPDDREYLERKEATEASKVTITNGVQTIKVVPQALAYYTEARGWWIP